MQNLKGGVNVSVLGDNIRRLRNEKGWSQEKLARKAEISRQTIFDYESGQTVNAGAKTMTKIAEALEVTIGELLEAVKPTLR